MERSRDGAGLAVLYSDLGLVAREPGEYEQAMRYYDESVRLMRQAGNHGGLADTWRMIARTYAVQERYHDAMACCQTSLALAERIDDELRVAGAWYVMVHCYEQLNEIEQAADLLERVVRIDRKFGLPKLKENTARLRGLRARLGHRQAASQVADTTSSQEPCS